MNIIDKMIQKKTIDKFGSDIQSTICMEECAELIQAISKMKRGKEDKRDNLIEEMADVYIILEQLQYIYDIGDSEIENWIVCKQDRQLRVLENAD
jgi:NTP pyrophosphatase (non-canonical NTP hydrolase)